MDKWKIGVIVLLLAGLAGYGTYQQNAPQMPQAPDPNTPQPTPKPANPKLLQLKGQAPPAWNIPANLWVNAPGPIAPASLKGNVTLMEFWRIGCHHCQETAPFLTKLYAQYKPRGLKMVTFHSPANGPDNIPNPQNPENNWNGVKQTIKNWGITYPVAYDENGKLFRETYGGDTFPAILLLDRAGKVQFVLSGHTPEKERELLAAVEKMLKAK